MGTDSRQADGGVPDSGERLPDEVVEELLDDECRRTMLAILSDSDGEMPLVDLAREILARERGCSPADVDTSDARELRTELYETHLPKLTATEVVAFDSLVSTLELETDDERLVSGEN